MSWRFVATSLIATLLTASAPVASAELYRFELTGTVNFSQNDQHHVARVGEPFIVNYRMNSNDEAPQAPGEGHYSGDSLTIKFPNALLTSKLEMIGRVFHFTSYDIVIFDGDVRTDVGRRFRAVFGVYFPPGTFQGSDALPLSVPLGAAEFTRFDLGGGLEPEISGQITSYAGTIVPEPLAPILYSFAAIGFLFKRKQLHVKKSPPEFDGAPRAPRHLVG